MVKMMVYMGFYPKLSICFDFFESLSKKNGDSRMMTGPIRVENRIR